MAETPPVGPQRTILPAIRQGANVNSLEPRTTMRWHGAGFVVDDLDYATAETQDPRPLVEVAGWISMVSPLRPSRPLQV